MERDNHHHGYRVQHCAVEAKGKCTAMLMLQEMARWLNMPKLVDKKKEDIMDTEVLWLQACAWDHHVGLPRTTYSISTPGVNRDGTERTELSPSSFITNGEQESMNHNRVSFEDAGQGRQTSAHLCTSLVWSWSRSPMRTGRWRLTGRIFCSYNCSKQTAA